MVCSDGDSQHLQDWYQLFPLWWAELPTSIWFLDLYRYKCNIFGSYFPSTQKTISRHLCFRAVSRTPSQMLRFTEYHEIKPSSQIVRYDTRRQGTAKSACFPFAGRTQLEWPLNNSVFPNRQTNRKWWRLPFVIRFPIIAFRWWKTENWRKELMVSKSPVCRSEQKRPLEVVHNFRMDFQEIVWSSWLSTEIFGFFG